MSKTLVIPNNRSPFWQKGGYPRGKVAVSEIWVCIIDRLRAVEAPTDMIDQLGGWSLKSVGQGYGDGYELKLSVKYISRIEIGLTW